MTLTHLLDLESRAGMLIWDSVRTSLCTLNTCEVVKNLTMFYVLPKLNINPVILGSLYSKTLLYT